MKKVTVRQMIAALEALPEEVKDLRFVVCGGGSPECDPTDDLKLYIQPKIIGGKFDHKTGRNWVEGPPAFVTLNWDY